MSGKHWRLVDQTHQSQMKNLLPCDQKYLRAVNTYSLIRLNLKALLNEFFTPLIHARETRQAYASFDLHPVRWYAILFLAVLVLISVAFMPLYQAKSL